VIAKGAVKQFLDRKLRDYSWLKKKKKWGFVCKIASMTPRPHLFKTVPYLHQWACFYIGVCLPRFLFLLDMGLGKTKIVLDIFEWRYNAGTADKMLVLVPNRVNVDGWAEEIEIHSRLDYVAVTGTTEQKWRKLEEPGEIFITHYPGFVHMVTKKVAAKKKKGKKVLEPDAAALQRIADKFDFVVLDEIHKVKDHKSVTYRALRKLSPLMACVYGMTGTPFGKNPENLWPQFNIVDLGETLGTTLGLFRESFFDQSFGFAGQYKYKLKRGAEELLHKVIQNRSVRYEDTECGDMPERIDIAVPITLTGEAFAYYKPTHATLTEGMRSNVAMADGVGHQYVQLREIASGFVMWKDDDGTKNKIVFKDNPKIDVIEELALELPVSRKMVIFHEYVESGRMIVAKLKSLGFAHAQARGEIKDAVQQVRRFKTDPECRFLVANIASGSVGGNYQIANTVVFFESPSSPIARTQAEKRCTGARQKQYRRVYVYDLITRATVEEDIVNSLKEGTDLFKSVVNGKAQISVPTHGL
jgi:SNF2 family DNA or RNA helicase